jgi:hypothetical protein
MASSNPSQQSQHELFTYVVRVDSGLAPNPFWGVCTLAVCTPNRQGSRVRCGDWVAGFLSKRRGHRFLYAMEVDEILGLDAYYRDPRFGAKKPVVSGSWRQRCGDNFYSRGTDGGWIRQRTLHHRDEASMLKDTRFATVYIGRRFWYLGQSAASLPREFAPLAGGRGTRVNHPPGLADAFRAWVAREFEPGLHGLPHDNTEATPYGERRVCR